MATKDKSEERFAQEFEQVNTKARGLLTKIAPLEANYDPNLFRTHPKARLVHAIYEELLVMRRYAEGCPTENSAILSIERRGHILWYMGTSVYMPVSGQRVSGWARHPGDAFDISLGHFEENKEGMSLDLLINLYTPATSRFEDLSEYKIATSHLDNDVVGNRLLKGLQFYHELNMTQLIEEYVSLLREVVNLFGEIGDFSTQEIAERGIPLEIPQGTYTFQDANYYDPEGSLNGEVGKLLRGMVLLDNWCDALPDLRDMRNKLKENREQTRDGGRIFVTKNHGGGKFEQIECASSPKKDEIFGIDEQLRQLEALVRAYGNGVDVPNIALLGLAGFGKSLSLKYLMGKTADDSGLRYFVVQTPEAAIDVRKNYETYLKQYLNDPSSARPVVIVDDLVTERGYHGRDIRLNFGGGLFDDYSNVPLVIISANPESWDNLDPALQQRLGMFTIKYDQNEQTEEIMDYYCKKFGFDPSTVEGYNGVLLEKCSGLSPREIMLTIQAERGLAIGKRVIDGVNLH